MIPFPSQQTQKVERQIRISINYEKKKPNREEEILDASNVPGLD